VILCENTLDLRRDAKLTVKDAKKISLLEPIVRGEYNKYIGTLVDFNNVKGLQWLLRLVCRNTDRSMLYYWLCKLSLLEYKLQKGFKIDKILIDYTPIEKPVKQLLNKYKVKCLVDITGKKKNIKLYFLTNLVRNLYHCINNYFWGLLFGKKIIPKEKILLLDTFFFKNTIKNGVIHDRYYPGLINSLTLIEQGNIFYLPTFYGLRTPLDYFTQFRKVSKLPEKIIFKECWLVCTDYMYAIWQSIILPKSITNIPKWRGINIADIVKDELMQDQAGASLTQAVLIERSFRRYKESGIRIYGIIDWFENQVVDRAIYLGARRNYPGVYIKGYQGFVVGKGYVGLQPIQYEYDGGVLPDELLVIGEAYVDDRRLECSKLLVSAAPAFRMKHVLNFKKIIKKKNTIILAMPMSLVESSEIVNLSLLIDLPENLKFELKVHPTITIEEFKKIIPQSVNRKIEFKKQSLSNLLSKACLVITSASSSALDAVLCGVSVVILGSRTTYTNNPLDGIVSSKNWVVCYTSTELQNAIINSQKTHQSLDVSYYLNSVSQAGVQKMIRNFKFN
jgi:hypothetical protein